MSWREALNCLELFVKFTEKSHYYNVAEVMDTHIMLNNAYKKRHSAIKQADIKDTVKLYNHYSTPFFFLFFPTYYT